MRKVQITEKIFNRLEIMAGIYISLFVMAPYLSVRIVNIGGVKLLVGGIGMILAYGILDVINEVYGANRAKQVVLSAASARLVVYCFIAISYALPTFHQPNGYSSIINQSFRILLAGEIALVATQYFIDVPLFSWIKKRLLYGFWVRYNLSNLVSQSIAAILFITLAFIGTGKPIISLIISQIFLRAILSITLTPVFVGIGRWAKHD